MKNRFLCSAIAIIIYSFTIHNCYYLISLCKTQLKTEKRHCRANNMKMQNNCIKSRTCFYSDIITKFEDFGFYNTIIEENSRENILIYNISYITLVDPKPLHIRFDKIDGFVGVYDRTRNLVLFDPEKYDAIGHRFRYHISQKIGTEYVFSHSYARFKFDSYDSLPQEKTPTLHNVIILI